MRIPYNVRALIGGLACGGVVLTHALSYRLAAQDPHAHLELMRRTGHGGWPYVVAIALGLLVASLAGYLVRALRSRPEAPRPLASYGHLVAGLGVLQGALFALLESVERLAVGGNVVQMTGEPAFAIGLALQGIVALIAALALVGFVRIVERVLRGRFAVPDRSEPPLPFAVIDVVPAARRLAVAGWSLRGPPIRSGS